ncbi:D-2-hydroxyacid dehydrogenase [Halomicroarcula sp. GCM10025324]|uniref:D-2-hydroxyacid dehydrogenase n=1 Tax=Haloarcula TaxID=2237 RepID=UPI0023E76449|nr:D-2-hydroxyacid dehydrogenase [Halomicroarcula sp. ZS-22-S1]
MTPDDVDILVLRSGPHGMPSEDYARELSQRLPDANVFHAATPEAERAAIKFARVVTSTRISTALLDQADNLELFAGAAAGYDHLPLDTFREMGVTVTNASGVHGPNIAEQVLGFVLMFTRRLDEAVRRSQRGEWRHFQAHELAGSTVTVVGLGAIGTAVVERLQGFDVETVGVRYTPEKGGPTDEVVGFEPAAFNRALARTDYLVLACPLTETTRGLLGDAEFDTLPPDAVVVNVGRGGLVDTPALVSAVQGNRIRGAALDVTDPEPLPADHALWDYENVLVTPHNAGHSPKYYERLADIVAGNVRRLDDGEAVGDLENVVLDPTE